MEQDMLTTSEPFDPVMAVYDGALAIKDVAAGLEGDRPGAAAALRMIAWHLKTAAELFDDEASDREREAPQGGPSPSPDGTQAHTHAIPTLSLSEMPRIPMPYIRLHSGRLRGGTAMADFSTAHAPVAVWEGGYGNHPADRGGETLCGIARGCHPDLALWKLVDAEKDHPSFRQGSAAFTRHLRQIPGLLEQVTAFYRGLFHSLGLDSDDMPQDLANEIYEQVVNLGQGGHTRYLQRICNAFNYNRKTGTRLFHDLKEDGALGTLTRAALRVLIEKRTTQAVLVHALNGAQAMHYINLAAGNETQRRFIDGWLTRTYDPEATA